MNRASSSKLLLAAGLAAFAAAACQSVATAQAPAAPPSPAWKAKNLQVLPADMARPQVIAIMKSFTRSLGVDCEYCHVKGADGNLDPASDANPHKAAARWMMTMLEGLNKEFGAKPGEPPKVTCYTCHRGSTTPLIAPPPADPAPAAHPPQS